VDARVRVAAVEVLRRLLDALPRLGLGRAGRGLRRALADLRTDVDDDQLLDELGPLGREVDRVRPPIERPTSTSEVTPSWSRTPPMSSNAAMAL